MIDRTELLEAALDSLAEGLALADRDGHVVFWNRAAEAITVYPGTETVGLRVREMLDTLVVGGCQHWILQTNAESSSHRGCTVQIRHKLAHELPIHARALVLRDVWGEHIGNGVIHCSSKVTPMRLLTLLTQPIPIGSCRPTAPIRRRVSCSRMVYGAIR